MQICNLQCFISDKLAHQCEECGKAFAWPSELKAHLKSHAGEKRFKCGICGKMFLYLTSLKGHMSNRHMFDGKFVCVVCKSCFNEATELILHMKTHSEDQSLKCERCYALFTSLKDLETHICTNFGGNPLLCVSCISEFKSTQEYCKHKCMKACVNRKCGCCLKVFKNLWHLREHLITHTAEKPYECTQCKTKFRRKRELEVHETRHNSKKPFSCQHCDETFSSDTYLKQHQRKVHRAKKFICHICNHAFMHRCALTNHVRFHEQTGNTEYGKKHHRDKEAAKEVSRSTSGSQPNLNTVDTDAKPVIVPSIILANAEQAPSNLTTIFEKKSDGNLVLRCASCSLIFLSHSDLLRHRKENHSDGKPYQCQQCFRTFALAANLSSHQNTHNAPPHKYICTKCGKGYKVTHKLRDHLKTKHGQDTQSVTDLELELGTLSVPDSSALDSPSYEFPALEFTGKVSDSLYQDMPDVLVDKTITNSELFRQ